MNIRNRTKFEMQHSMTSEAKCVILVK